jgi:uncharacterized membrane protein (UPF0127 family)
MSGPVRSLQVLDPSGLAARARQLGSSFLAFPSLALVLDRWTWSAARALAPVLALAPALVVVPALAAAPADSAPQVLPLTAQACLLRPEGAAPVCLQLEEPRNLRQYTLGLQLRPPLKPLQGMWFAYTPPSVVRFWMHHTPAPLDMLFIRDGQVRAIVAAAPPCMRLPCRSYGPDQAVDGVLEIGSGQAAALGIRVGTALRITPLSPSARSAPAPD